jgi:hypothetical protein
VQIILNGQCTRVHYMGPGQRGDASDGH